MMLENKKRKSILKIVTSGTFYNKIFDNYVNENNDIYANEKIIRYIPKFLILISIKILISLKIYDEVYFSDCRYAKTYVKYFGKKALTKDVLSVGFDLIELKKGNKQKLIKKYNFKYDQLD